MSGTNNGLIFIIIVPIVCLAFSLGMVFYSASHPEWRRDTAGQARDNRGALPAQPGRPDVGGGRPSPSRVAGPPSDRSPQ